MTKGANSQGQQSSGQISPGSDSVGLSRIPSEIRMEHSDIPSTTESPSLPDIQAAPTKRTIMDVIALHYNKTTSATSPSELESNQPDNQVDLNLI